MNANLTSILKLKLPQAITPVTVDDRGLDNVTLFYALKLLQNQLGDDLYMEREMAEIDGKEIALPTMRFVDEHGRLYYGGLPVRATSRPDSVLEDVYVVEYICRACKEAEFGRKVCGADKGWTTKITKLTPAQYFAWYLTHSEFGDSPLEHILTSASGASADNEAVSAIIRRYLTIDAMGKLILPTGDGMKRLLDAGLDVGKVRLVIPTAPWHVKQGVHPAESKIETIDEVIEKVAKAAGCSIMASSSSSPGDVLYRKGQHTDLPALIEYMVPGAHAHLDRSRMTPCASALANAITLVDNDEPVVRVSTNPGTFVGGRVLLTAIVNREGNKKDMIEIHPDAFEKFKFYHLQKVVVPQGFELHVKDGDVFIGNKALIASSLQLNGRKIYYRSTEFTDGVRHLIRVKGDVVPETFTNPDGDEVTALIAKDGVIVEIETLRTMLECSKAIDLNSNKGLVNPMQEKLFVKFCGHFLPVEATLREDRMRVEDPYQELKAGETKPKAKTCSAILQARASQIAAMRHVMYGEDLVINVEPHATLEEVNTAYVNTIAEMGLWLGEQPGGSEAALRALEQSDAYHMTMDDEEAHFYAEMQLGKWPLYRLEYRTDADGKIINHYELLDEALISWHFWTLQPQLPEIQTGTAPVEHLEALYDEDGQLQTKQNTSKSGTIVWSPCETAHLEIYSPKVAGYLLDGRGDIAVREYGKQLLRSLLLRGGSGLELQDPNSYGTIDECEESVVIAD